MYKDILMFCTPAELSSSLKRCSRSSGRLKLLHLGWHLRVGVSAFISLGLKICILDNTVLAETFDWGSLCCGCEQSDRKLRWHNAGLWKLLILLFTFLSSSVEGKCVLSVCLCLFVSKTESFTSLDHFIWKYRAHLSLSSYYYCHTSV